MNFTPLYDHILVKRDDVLDKTEAGIYLAPTAVMKEKPAQGKVIAVGPGKAAPLAVKVDNTVLFGKYSGNEIMLDKDLFVVLREDEVFGILSE